MCLAVRELLRHHAPPVTLTTEADLATSPPPGPTHMTHTEPQEPMTLDATSTVTPLLPRGDLACELSDRNPAQGLHVQWLFRAGPASFAGPARTVDARGGDVPAVREAAAKVNEGEVLIIDAD